MRIGITTSLLILGICFFTEVEAQETNPQSVSKIFVQEQESQLEISASGNTITVANAPLGSILEIYSVVGIKVKEIEMKQASGEYIVDIAKGYYIIRIGEIVRKVAIR